MEGGKQVLSKSEEEGRDDVETKRTGTKTTAGSEPQTKIR